MTATINNYYPQVPQNINVEQTKKDEKSEVKTSDNTWMSTNSKVMIGLGALAAIAIAGISIKKLAGSQKIIKNSIEEFYSQIEKIGLKQASNHGKTVEQTIENTFGKGSEIQAHSYDLTKESPVISVMRNWGGFKSGLVCQKGLISNGLEFDKVISDMPEVKSISSLMSSPQNFLASSEYVTIGESRGASINKGIYKLNGIKRAIIRLNLQDERKNPYNIIIVSPNSKFSPAQQDLLKLAETPDKFNAEVFDRITASHGSEYFRKNGSATKMPDEDLFKGAEYENLDYNLILSAIQSMVK